MIKKKKDKTIIIRMNSLDYDIFKQICLKSNFTPSFVIRRYIEGYVRAYKQSSIFKPLHMKDR